MYTFKIYDLINKTNKPVVVFSRFLVIGTIKLAWACLGSYGACKAIESTTGLFDFEVLNADGLHVLGITMEESEKDSDFVFSQ